MHIIQNRIRPLSIKSRQFATLEDAQQAHDELVGVINDVLTRVLDDNSQRVEQWGNRINRTSWNLLFLEV